MKVMTLGSTGAFGTALHNVCKEDEYLDISLIELSHKDFEITDKQRLEDLIVQHNPDAVINSVAMVGINPCELDPQKAFDVNSIAVSNLANLCKLNDATLV